MFLEFFCTVKRKMHKKGPTLKTSHANTATEKELVLIFACEIAFMDLFICVTIGWSAAESTRHYQLIVYRGCHFVMEVGEKQSWPKAIFITSFLSVSLSGKASMYRFQPAAMNTHT